MVNKKDGIFTRQGHLKISAHSRHSVTLRINRLEHYLIKGGTQEQVV